MSLSSPLRTSYPRLAIGGILANRQTLLLLPPLRSSDIPKKYSITALAICRQFAPDCRHVMASCGHVTAGLYITSSGAPVLPLPFL